MTEQEIERALIEKLGDLKYTYRPDIRDRSALEANFRQHFAALNRVRLAAVRTVKKDPLFAQITQRRTNREDFAP